jgi:oligopeptide transport system substrate-binding protein
VSHCFGIVCLFVIPFILLLSCTKKSTEGLNVFRYPIESEPTTLDWSVMEDHIDFDVLSNVHYGLARYDRQLNVIPSLAEKWEISPDGKTYSFFLRDSKWSDGVPVRAQDFVYSWLRILEPKRSSPYAYVLFDVENAEQFNHGKISDPALIGISAPDDKTFQVKLKHPASFFIHIAAFQLTFPMRQDIVDAHPNDFTEPNFIRTTGPYRITHWTHNLKITLETNPYFFGEKPKIPKVEYLIVREESTGLNMFDRGEIDVVNRLPSFDHEALKKRPEYKCLPNLRMNYYGFINDRAPFNKVLVRRAFNHALDRTKLIQKVKSNKLPAQYWIPEGMLAHDATVGLRFDPKLAKKELSEAGYPEGKEFPKITLFYDTNGTNKNVAEAVVESWKTILNIPNIEMHGQDIKGHITEIRKGIPNIFRLGWGADYPDPQSFMDLFKSNSGNNHLRWGNKKYDSLVDKADVVLNTQERVALYENAQRLLLEDEVALIPLMQETIEMLVSQRVKNFTVDPLENPRISESSF